MGKGKPRHNPNKIQNTRGDRCMYYETDDKGKGSCELGYGDINICKGNRHNCIKVKYKKQACKKNPLE